MSRSIEFRHHPDTPQPCIVDDLLDIIERVHHRGMVCTLGRQIRIAGALIGEAIVVHDVPVENVHFVVRHGVQREQYVVNGKVMARRVQQESTMRQPREIYDTLASYLQLRERRERGRGWDKKKRYIFFLFIIYSSRDETLYSRSIHPRSGPRAEKRFPTLEESPIQFSRTDPPSMFRLCSACLQNCNEFKFKFDRVLIIIDRSFRIRII